jgi:hypothetical protein
MTPDTRPSVWVAQDDHFDRAQALVSEFARDE